MFDDLNKSLDRANGGLFSVLRGLPQWLGKKRANQLRRELHQQGYDAATIEACANAAKENQPYDHILEHAHQNRKRIADTEALMADPPPDHGSARWSTRNDLNNAQLLKPFRAESWLDGSLFLGFSADDTPSLQDVPNDVIPNAGQGVFWNGEQHLVTVAPSRTGKATAQIVPNLLSYPGAAIVFDPKGELFDLTSNYRQENVGDVFVINPFKASTVGDYTDAFDPLETLQHYPDQIGEKAAALAATVAPRKQDQNSFFADEVQALLKVVFEYAARYHPELRMPDLVRIMTDVFNPEFKAMIEAMRGCEEISISTAAREYSGKDHTSKRRFFESLNTDIQAWRSAGICDATRECSFYFENMKHESITVYFVMTFEQMQAYSAYVQTMISLMLDALTQTDDPPNHKILMIMDEFLALDPFPKYVESLRRLPSYGIRAWTFLQNISDLESKYPKTWKSFFDAEVEIYFGTNNQDTLKYLSDKLGDKTISRHSSAESVGSTHYSVNDSSVLKARRLMYENEIKDELTYKHASSCRYSYQFIDGVRGSATKTVLLPYFQCDFLSERIGSIFDEN